MRALLLVGAAALAFATTLSFAPTTANAVVSARGANHAGCAGPNGAVVARKPAVTCTRVLVNGICVKRCT